MKPIVQHAVIELNRDLKNAGKEEMYTYAYSTIEEKEYVRFNNTKIWSDSTESDRSAEVEVYKDYFKELVLDLANIYKECAEVEQASVTIEELCAYLPYAVMVVTSSDDVGTIVEVDFENKIVTFSDGFSSELKDIKLVLKEPPNTVKGAEDSLTGTVRRYYLKNNVDIFNLIDRDLAVKMQDC